WGKTESQAKKQEEEPKPEPLVTKTKPEKKELPQAPLRPDPLLEPEKYSRRTEEAPKAPAAVAQSPLLSGSKEAKPTEKVGPVQAKADEAGKAGTARVPLGAGWVMAAYDQSQPGQVYSLPVPMMTVPPTAHTIRPPQVATSLPAEVNQAMVNAFTGGD